MSDSPFVTRTLPSRRLQQTIAIPWASETPVAVVPFTAYAQTAETKRRKSTKYRSLDVVLSDAPQTPVVGEPFTAYSLQEFRRTRATARRRIAQAELPAAPQTPVGYYSGFYPGSKAVTVHRVKFKQHIQLLPELNEYSATDNSATSGYYPAFTAIKANRISFSYRRVDAPELNTYPATPAGYYSGFYPGSKAVQSLTFGFDINIQRVQLNEYPQTPAVPEQPMTAFAPVAAISRKATRYKANNISSVISITYTAPAVRVFVVSDESRTFTVSAESRTYTVPST